MESGNIFPNIFPNNSYSKPKNENRKKIHNILTISGEKVVNTQFSMTYTSSYKSKRFPKSMEHSNNNNNNHKNFLPKILPNLNPNMINNDMGIMGGRYPQKKKIDYEKYNINKIIGNNNNNNYNNKNKKFNKKIELIFIDNKKLNNNRNILNKKCLNSFSKTT